MFSTLRLPALVTLSPSLLMSRSTTSALLQLVLCSVIIRTVLAYSPQYLSPQLRIHHYSHPTRHLQTSMSNPIHLIHPIPGSRRCTHSPKKEKKLRLTLEIRNILHYMGIHLPSSSALRFYTSPTNNGHHDTNSFTSCSEGINLIISSNNGNYSTASSPQKLRTMLRPKSLGYQHRFFHPTCVVLLY